MNNTSFLPAFAHRQNQDGTIDAICTTCFSTVARSFWKFNLEQKELEHHCNGHAEIGNDDFDFTPADARFGT